MCVLRRCFSILLAGLLLQLVITPRMVAAQTSSDTRTETDARSTAKVKADVASFGFGTEARVKVKLRDGRKLKGYISYAGDEKFAVVDPKTDDTTTVPYVGVAEIKRTKGSQSRAVLLGVAFTVVGLVALGAILGGVGDL